jgi:hypothetical protein
VFLRKYKFVFKFNNLRQSFALYFWHLVKFNFFVVFPIKQPMIEKKKKKEEEEDVHTHKRNFFFDKFFFLTMRSHKRNYITNMTFMPKLWQ